MPSEEEFGKRIESEAMGANQITNDDLICADCINATVETSRCLAYPYSKPNAVLYGSNRCAAFETME